MRRDRRHTRRAFTLAELVVVLVVLAILAAIAVVAMRAISGRASLATHVDRNESIGRDIAYLHTLDDGDYANELAAAVGETTEGDLALTATAANSTGRAVISYAVHPSMLVFASQHDPDTLVVCYVVAPESGCAPMAGPGSGGLSAVSIDPETILTAVNGTGPGPDTIPGGPTTTTTPTTTLPPLTVPPTTVPPTTTTPTTTAPATTAPTTTAPATTAPTTTLPPGIQFQEPFNTDTRNRFDWQLYTSVNSGTQSYTRASFLGDHDLACADDAQRTVNGGLGSPTYLDAAATEHVYWCDGHMMTALDTIKSAAISFSPKQTFTDLHGLCWSQSMTNMGGGRWLNVFIVPGNPTDLNFTSGPGATWAPTPNALPPGSVSFTWVRGSVSALKVLPNGTYDQQFDQWMSIDPSDTNGNGEIDPGDAPTPGMATDPNQMFQVCIDDLGDAVYVFRPNGDVSVYPFNIEFPDGEARVIFQDHANNPTGFGAETDSLTWHWDDIVIG